MASQIVDNILKRLKQPDLLKILSSDLSGTELNSLLLEVFSNRTTKLTHAQVFRQYQQNRFVKPAALSVLEIKQMELDVLRLFSQHKFEPLELSPVCTLGSCSVMGAADQKKVLSALRNSEVLADNTNAIALHVTDLKQKKRSAGTLRFANVQRMLRTQAITGKGFTPHFKIASLVSCGVDTGSFDFERSAMFEHMQVMRTLLLDYYKVQKVSFRLLRRSGYDRDIAGIINDSLRQHDHIEVSAIQDPDKEINYYKGVQYKIDVWFGGRQYEVGDGGFVDWTQHLLQNKKERMFTTGFGFEFMYRILRGEIQ